MDGDSWTSHVSSVTPVSRDLTIALYKVLQGLEGSGLAGGVGLLLVFLQHLVHVRIFNVGQSSGAEQRQQKFTQRLKFYTNF